MAEHVIPAIVGGAASAVVSSVKSKIDELGRVADKINLLEWKLRMIESAIEESKKYVIDNVPLLEWQQKLIDAAKEGEDILQDSKNQFTASDPQHLIQGVQTTAGPICPEMSSAAFLELTTFGIFLVNAIKQQMRLMINFLKRFTEIEKLNRTLEKLEVISNDIGIFLEMVRQQKRKRDRRRRYRPYKDFFELLFVYLELLHIALGYCRAPGYKELLKAGAGSNLWYQKCGLML